MFATLILFISKIKMFIYKFDLSQRWKYYKTNKFSFIILENFDSIHNAIAKYYDDLNINKKL